TGTELAEELKNHRAQIIVHRTPLKNLLLVFDENTFDLDVRKSFIKYFTEKGAEVVMKRAGTPLEVYQIAGSVSHAENLLDDDVWQHVCDVREKLKAQAGEGEAALYMTGLVEGRRQEG